MTRKQLEAIRNQLNTKYYGNECRHPDNLKMPISDEDKRTFTELNCIEMIDSCLAYGDDPFRVINQWWYGHGYCDRSYMSEYEEILGKERVKELVDQQREEFSHAIIKHGVYTDSEGCTYNSVIYADEQ